MVGFVEQMGHHFLELLEVGCAVVRLADEHVHENTEKHRANLGIRPLTEGQELLERIGKVGGDHECLVVRRGSTPPPADWQFGNTDSRTCPEALDPKGSVLTMAQNACSSLMHH
jgi:hypothetical protein